MICISGLLSRWFVPRDQYEGVQALAQTYLEQLEDYERTVEIKKLFTKKIDYLGRLLLDEDFSPLDVETDEFYSRLESQINHIRRSKAEMGFRLARIGATFCGVKIESPPQVSDSEYNQIELKVNEARSDHFRFRAALRKAGAIALRDGDAESLSDDLSEDEIQKIHSAIADLRGRIADLEEENVALKDREQNYIESLQLSQQKVSELKTQFSDYMGVMGRVVEFYKKIRTLGEIDIPE